MNALLLAVALLAPMQTPSTTKAPSVIFVCGHGAAKSVIATAYFNKLSAERGLPYRATFRGTSSRVAANYALHRVSDANVAQS